MSFLPKPKNPHWFLYGYIWAALYYFALTWIAQKFVDPALFAMVVIYSQATFIFGYYNKMPLFWLGFTGLTLGFIIPDYRHLLWLVGMALGLSITVFRRYYKKGKS